MSFVQTISLDDDQLSGMYVKALQEAADQQEKTLAKIKEAQDRHSELLQKFEAGDYGRRIQAPPAFDAGEQKQRAWLWNNVINVEPGVRRLVATRDLSRVDQVRQQLVAARKELQELGKDIPNEGGHYSGTTASATDDKFVPYHLWVPKSQIENFDLVLSLCDDGSHRPLYDLDVPYESADWSVSSYGLTLTTTFRGSRFQVKLKEPNCTVSRSSSGNIHVWSNRRVNFADYCHSLAEIPLESARMYKEMVVLNGYGALRAPWCKKEEQDNV
jgi:hypothetical protein